MTPKRIDKNQPIIVEQLRKIPGVSVTHTHTIGKGMVDIIVGVKKTGRNYLIELKDPSQPPSKRKLTDDEERFHNGWQGQIDVAETVEDVLKIIGFK